MNILALSEARWKMKKSGEESGTTDGRRDTGTGSKHPSETTEEYNGAGRKHAPPDEETTDRLIPILEDAEKEESKSSDDDIHLDTTIDEFERNRGVTGSNLDRQNLIDLLYNEGCISLLHKQHIEQQPTQQQQNLQILQLIENGSIKTFKVAREYFRVTNQDHVFDMLNRKYCSKGNLIYDVAVMLIRTWVSRSRPRQSCPRVGWIHGSGRVGSGFCRILAGRFQGQGQGRVVQHFGFLSFLLIIS